MHTPFIQCMYFVDIIFVCFRSETFLFILYVSGTRNIVSIQKSCTEGVIESLSKQSSYLDSILVPLVLLDDNVDNKEKMNIAKAIVEKAPAFDNVGQ